MTLTQITEKGIKDGEIVNADIDSNAGIAGSKISPAFTSSITGTSDLQIAGTVSIPTDKLQLSFSAPEGHIKVKNSSGAPAANLGLHTTDASGNTNRVLHLRHDGNVGISTSTPSRRLQIKSAGVNATQVALLDANSTNEVFRVGQQSDGDGFVQVLTDSGAGGVQLEASGNSYFIGGNVGIGIGSPGQLLHLSRSSTTAYSASSTANDTTLMVQNTGAAGHATIEMQVKSSGTSQTGQATIGAFTEAASSRATSLSFGTRNASSAMEERMRINSSGFVGTYRTNPKGSLHTSNREIVSSADPTTSAEPNATYDGLIVDGEAASIINLRSRGDGNASYAGLFFSDNVRAAGQFIYQHKDDTSVTDYFQYNIGGTEVARINAYGVKLPSGKGINFHNYGSGTTVSSNFLDDYEEGTWTPSYTVGSGGGNMVNNATYNATGGVYTKVGKLVLFSGRIQLNSGFTVIGGHVVINGLPVTTHSGVNGVQCGATFGYRAALGSNAVEMYIPAGSNQIQFYDTAGNAYYAGAGGNNFANALHFWGCYHSA